LSVGLSFQSQWGIRCGRDSTMRTKLWVVVMVSIPMGDSMWA